MIINLIINHTPAKVPNKTPEQPPLKVNTDHINVVKEYCPCDRCGCLLFCLRFGDDDERYHEAVCLDCIVTLFHRL